MSLTLESPAFANNGLIPSEYTCEGTNQSPPLVWEGAPSNTQSYVLMVNDPEAVSGNYIHWLLFNLTANTTQLATGAPTPSGATAASNDSGATKYYGPCPPTGTHHYYFNLYALDTMLPLDETATEEDVAQAMKNHILDQTSLVGLYKKK